ncbi:MAG: class I SAM-dependent methyltransferase [Deltaproteobacteria bacterium]|nr:class I SAM-dependent methyltransferase [Deltaproteobacteria bacterium]
MSEHVCPPWLGYLLLNPLRKLLENPDKMFGQFVRDGMVVLEPGCGMGYFTLPLARMVGPDGRVVAVELQNKMLSVLKRRASKAGLIDIIELRQTEADGLGVEDLSGEVDFAVAIHLVHEIPDQGAFFAQIWQALKPGGKLLFVEPKGHVSLNSFKQTVAVAKQTGFERETLPGKAGKRKALLIKPSPLGTVP